MEGNTLNAMLEILNNVVSLFVFLYPSTQFLFPLSAFYGVASVAQNNCVENCNLTKPNLEGFASKHIMVILCLTNAIKLIYCKYKTQPKSSLE